MIGKLWLGIILALALCAAAACGSQNEGAVNVPDRGTAAFDLSVLNESFVGGATAGATYLSVDDYDTHVVVNVHVEDAAGLKALYLELGYNPEQYRPMTSEPTDAMGDRSDIINLNYFKDRGTVHYGQVLTNLDLRPGMTGDGIVAQVQFVKEATPAVRTVSAAPSATASAPVLTTDGVDTLNWHYASIGDYDQNSEVNIADLTPLGVNFLDVGPFAYETSLSVVDGDSNGEINLADVTPIGQNFQRVVSGYGIYGSANTADAGTNTSPATNDDHTIDALDTVDFSTAVGAQGERLRFTYTIAAVDPSFFYWVRPLDGTNEGTRSNLVSFNPANTATFTLQNPPATGSGTSVDPYVLADNATLTFIVNHPADGDVSTDPATQLSVSDPAASASPAAGVNTVTITAGYTGNFFVGASYQTVATAPPSLFFQVGTITPTGLFINEDPADADWAAVPAGDGTEADPWLLHTAAFNPDTNADGIYEIEFSMQAYSEAAFTTEIDNETLTWGTGITPFNVTGINDAGSKGTFQVNFFTNGYVFAQDPVTLDESAKVYVVSEGLPSS